MIQLLYPSLCLHCGCRVFSGKSFCEGCALFFQLEEGEESSCGYKNAAVLDYVAAVCTFVQLVKRGLLTKLALSLLLVKFAKLRWELPDLIIPLPSRGKQYYAKAFAKALGVPLDKRLGRKRAVVPQMKLPLEERKTLSAANFTFKGDVVGKRVLLIDDLIVTGATIKAALHHLYGAEKIYVLALAKMAIRPLASKIPAPHQ